MRKTRAWIVLSVLALAGCEDAASQPVVAQHGALRAFDPDFPGEGPEPWQPELEPEPNAPIIRGQPCTNPAAVYLSAAGRFRCSGTMIAPNLMLTAAHCVTAVNGQPAPELTTLSVGQGAAACPLSPASVLAVEVDPRYQDGEANHDAALVRLRQPLSSAVSATVGAFPAYQSAVDIVGFGMDSMEATQPHYQLCKTATVVGTTKGEITLSRDNGACRGDSGGPVFARGTNVLVGILSIGLDGKTCASNTLAGPIDRDWLETAKQRVQQQSASCAPGSTMACRPEGGQCFGFDASGNPLGSCQVGQRSCSGAGEWGECSGYVGPNAEVCHNGLDEDCNGAIDDGCAPLCACGDGQCGCDEASACPQDCQEGSPLACPPNFGWNAALQQCLCALQCPAGTTVNPFSCGCESGCGDGYCSFDETRYTCGIDCGCGNRICDGGETSESCSTDCGSSCICDVDCPLDTRGCPQHGCGDGVCDLPLENAYDCPQDCASGGGGGGDGGGGGKDSGLCGDQAFWDDVLAYYGEEIGWDLYVSSCFAY